MAALLRLLKILAMAASYTQLSCLGLILSIVIVVKVGVVTSGNPVAFPLFVLMLPLAISFMILAVPALVLNGAYIGLMAGKKLRPSRHVIVLMAILVVLDIAYFVIRQLTGIWYL